MHGWIPAILHNLSMGGSEIEEAGATFKAGPTTRHGQLFERSGVGRPRAVGTNPGRRVPGAETTSSNNPLQSR